MEKEGDRRSRKFTQLVRHFTCLGRTYLGFNAENVAHPRTDDLVRPTLGTFHLSLPGYEGSSSSRVVRHL